MKRIFVPTGSGSDWQRLLAQPSLHWKRGRSAMTTAACWESSPNALPPEISKVLDAADETSLRSLELLAAIPEWEVALPGGERASHTDVLALARNDCGLVVVAVEAKVEEPFGPTLGEKREGASSGQTARIRYLERELGCSSPIGDDVRYQLLHRTVSAKLTAQAFHASTAVMLVQSFSPNAKWREDFDAFTVAVSAEPVTRDLSKLRVSGLGSLFVGWCRGASSFLEVELPSAL